jgi:hypothetical protein
MYFLEPFSSFKSNESFSNPKIRRSFFLSKICITPNTKSTPVVVLLVHHARRTVVLVFLLDQTTLFRASLELSLSSEFRNPFSVLMDKIPKELGVPPTKLSYNGCLFDIRLAFWKRLV